MKNTFYLFLVASVWFICFSSFAQENEKPFVVSPLIGDTLSLEERDYYRILPIINNFQWAVFYLNPDSLIDVRISYIKRNQVRDTLISNYKSLQNLRIHLFKRDIENSRRVTAYLENNFSISGSFLSINHDSVLIYSEECKGQTLSSNCLIKIDNARVKKFVISGHSNIGNSMIWCTIIGTLAGSAIGLAVYEGAEQFRGLSIVGGGLIGCCTGLLTGLIYGSITSEPDIVIQPFTEDNIKGISRYSVFPNGALDELEKIK